MGVSKDFSTPFFCLYIYESQLYSKTGHLKGHFIQATPLQRGRGHVIAGQPGARALPNWMEVDPFWLV